jgi:hypothetical protein
MNAHAPIPVHIGLNPQGKREPLSLSIALRVSAILLFFTSLLNLQV